MNNNKALINLHEELFHFLMNYRKTSNHKHIEKFTFSFRPLTDIEELSQGRWFYDSPKNGWVNLFLTESKEQKHWNHNLQFGVNIKGYWSITINVRKYIETEKTSSFWERLTRSFYNVATFETKRQGQFPDTVYASDQVTMYPKNKDYRSGLYDAIDTFLNFYEEERNIWTQKSTEEPPIKFISENAFSESLQTIQNFRKQKKPTCVYLNNFFVEGYQGIINTSVPSFPNSPSWIFLTGENGFGKTSILKAITLGLYGDSKEANFPDNKKFNVELSYTYKNSQTVDITVENNTENPLFFRRLPVLATYGPSRLEIQATDSHHKQIQNNTATYNLFNTDGLLRSIEAELLISFYDARPKFAAISDMLNTVIPSLSHIELNKRTRRILYYEKAKGEVLDEKYSPIGFNQLASGVRSVIAMVGDIYLRLSEARESLLSIEPYQYGSQQDEVTYDDYAPESLFGIVIIDELDLHLHPKWQRVLPTLLSKVFPKVQFIASTHSPIPLLGAPPNSVFLKVNRTIKEGVTVERLSDLEKEMSNLLPNAILTSPIFDLDDLFPVTHKSEEAIKTADNYKEILADKELKDKLHKLAENFKFPDNLKNKKDEEGQ